MKDSDSFEFWRDLRVVSGERMVLAPGHSQPFHREDGALTLVYLSAGGGTMQQGNQTFLLRAHDVFLLLPGRRALFQAAAGRESELYPIGLSGVHGLEQLTQQLSISPREPLLQGICNPNFLKYLRILSHLYDHPALTDQLRFQAALYELCSILLEEFSPGSWRRLRYDHPDISYTGEWAVWPHPNAGNEGECYTAKTRSYAELSFEGTGIKWYGVMNFDCGKADVILDGQYQTTIDAYSPERLSRQLLYVQTRLPAGRHIVKIFCSGRRNFLATNYDVVIEEFQVLTDTPAPPAAPACTPLIARAIAYAQEHSQGTLTTELWARQLGVSRSYFSTRFKQETGVSPHAYLLKLRLLRARHALIYSRQSIGDIAQSCGFCDVSYFTRVFQSQEKLTPTQFRALHQKNER